MVHLEPVEMIHLEPVSPEPAEWIEMILPHQALRP